MTSKSIALIVLGLGLGGVFALVPPSVVSPDPGAPPASAVPAGEPISTGATTPGVAEIDRPELALGRTEVYDYDPPVPGTYTLPVIEPAGDGEVLVADRGRRQLRDVLAGRISLVSFIYTSCADPRACPLATGVLYRIHKLSARDARLTDSLRLVTFSFDPETDTPSVMARYGRGLAPDGQGAEWLFLTTAGQEQLAPILASYGQRVDRKKDPADPTGALYHVLRVYLVDRAGNIRNIYSFGQLDPRLVLADVRTLLLEEEAEGASR
ncbi:MAG: SCO family protein [Candidatus Krumholzibacteriia bacterium]